MKKVGMFYPMPWCARFFRFYTFSRRINMPPSLVHPLKVIDGNGFLKVSTIGNGKQSFQ
jgi:hypothetical protein